MYHDFLCAKVICMRLHAVLSDWSVTSLHVCNYHTGGCRLIFWQTVLVSVKNVVTKLHVPVEWVIFAWTIYMYNNYTVPCTICSLATRPRKSGLVQTVLY